MGWAMAKKKLTIQQRARIARKHENFVNLSDEAVQQGLVITRGKNKALVADDSGKHFLCMIRPDIMSLVVGDKVSWQPTTEGAGVIESVHPRAMLLSRTDRYGTVKALAANLTQMIVVIAPKPEPSDLLVDSYIVAAELMGVKLSIIFNKIDIDDTNLMGEYHKNYQSFCHQFITNSIKSPNLAELEALLKDEINIFVGQSGVGKSSIIRLLLPNLADEIATSPLSQIHEFGQHTTSNAYYFHLPFGGAIIDSPGVRSFGLGKIKPHDLLWGFKEFRPFIGLCKFRDCDHLSSANCAILNAVKKEQISEKRYKNYVKMLGLNLF